MTTSATEIAGLVGEGVDRVDGPAKVTGTARYPADFGFDDLAYAVLVQSAIAAGRIRAIDTAAAQAAPGVLAVITHQNAPRLARAPGGLGIGPPPPLQDDRIVHHGQHIAVVYTSFRRAAIAAMSARPAQPAGTQPGQQDRRVGQSTIDRLFYQRLRSCSPPSGLLLATLEEISAILRAASPSASRKSTRAPGTRSTCTRWPPPGN